MASLDIFPHISFYYSFIVMFFHVLHVAGACKGRGFWIQASPFLWRLGRGCRGDSEFDSENEGLEDVIWLTFLKNPFWLLIENGSQEARMEAGRSGEAGRPKSLQTDGFLEMKLTQAFHFICSVSPPTGVQETPQEGPKDLQTPFSWWLKVKVWFSSCLLSLHLVTHFPTIWPFLALEK